MRFERFKAMIFLASVAALFLTAPAMAEPAQDDFSVAILHGVWGKNAMHDEFDKTMAKLGWKTTKFASTVEDMERFSGLKGKKGEIFNHDMVLFCPLFNYTGKIKGVEQPPGIDMRPYAPAFKKFVEEGGAVILVDCLYPGYYDWLTSIDPTLGVGEERPCQSGTNSWYDATDPLCFLPNTLGGGSSWGHLTLPKNHSWKVLTHCQCGHPMTLVKRMGKGYIYLTGVRYWDAMAQENFRANLETSRMGLYVTAFDFPTFGIGKGELHVSVKNISKETVTLTGDLAAESVSDPKQRISEKSEVTLKPGETGDLSLDWESALRGDVLVTFFLRSGKVSARLFHGTVHVPGLLTTLPPCYRSFAIESEIKKRGGMRIGYEIVPFREKLDTMEVKTFVKTKDGKVIGPSGRRKAKALRERFYLDVRKLSPGEYVLHSELSLDGFKTVAAKSSAPFRILKDDEVITFIDDDMNFIVDGKPFFPIGLYHIAPEDFEKFEDIGVNMVQLFSWHGYPGQQKILKKHGIKILWEQNFRTPDTEKLRGFLTGGKALENEDVIFWYAQDEPGDNELASAEALSKSFHEIDVRRPTYMVSCSPRLLEKQAKCADIIAPDPYPYGGPNSSIVGVANWVGRAWKATKWEKPVICVPQSFGEPEGPFRAMAYLALTHEARGLIWYPWDDQWFDQYKRPVGLRHHPDQQKVFRDICNQIKALTPALLNKQGRRQFKSEDGAIHGLFCQDPDGTRYMMIVNPHKVANQIDFSKIEALWCAGSLERHFGEGTKTCKADATMDLKPYETGVYIVK